MKPIFKKGIVGALVATMAMATAIPAISAAENVMIRDTDQKVSFKANCNDPGYTFQLYKIGSFKSSDNGNAQSPYRTGYNSLIPNDAAIAAAMANGYTAGKPSTEEESTLLQLLEAKYNPKDNDGNYIPANANEPAQDPLNSLKVGDPWTSSAQKTSQTYSNLDQGVYYVRAINWPAGVTYVRNSVFALPYYGEDGWTYTIDDIPLATKVDDHPVETYKTITNTTIKNPAQNISNNDPIKALANNMHGIYQPATDVDLGDTVNFEIRSTITGSDQMKLNSYYVTDVMSNGLTLDKNSFHMYLLDKDGNQISELQQGTQATNADSYKTASKDYVILFDQTNNGEGNKTTNFTVYLTREFLHKNSAVSKFYGTGSAQDNRAVFTKITYSAMLNDKAVVGKAGNPNTEGKIEWSNKNDVTQDYQGNTVYVYTWGVRPHKTDDSSDPRPLAGAEFKLFATQADAEALKNPIAEGTSDNTGLVKFMTKKYNGFSSTTATEISLERGTYYAVETKAPTGYQTYGKVIEIQVGVTYNDAFANNTWVKTSPADGTADGFQALTIKNTRLETPNTGGAGDYIAYYIAGGVGLLGLIGLAVAMTKKRSKKIK